MTAGVDAHIVLILTVGLTFASFLGYLAFKYKFSPILGYLLAGYMIGPFSPGFVADIKIAEQLAEIGVILMMFGVGLHFRIEDLAQVKKLAVPGGVGQVIVATISGCILLLSLGFGLEAGLVYGLAISVASTVVIVRVLSDNKLLNTPLGHIAVGWTIVEDIITIFILLLLPTLANFAQNGTLSIFALGESILISTLKFILFGILMFTLGRYFISKALGKIVDTRYPELFTLTVLALTFLIATGSAYLFGTSIALGAFISGMVMGETTMAKRVSNNAMPLKDAFVVMFFISVGMLFNPVVIWENFSLFLGSVFIIMVLKPLAAIVICRILQTPITKSIMIGVALAQIGEFSFILVEEALKFGIFPDDIYDIVVASSLVSIALNPILFRFFKDKPLIEEKV